MLNELISRYAWADDYSADGIESWTVAAIEGRTADDVVRVYGGDPVESVGDYTFARTLDLQGDGALEPLRFHVQTVNLDHHVLAIENNGYTGNLPEIARRCSANGGRFFAVYWSVNSNPRINQAIDGRVTANFEMFAGDKSYLGEPAPPWITGITIDVHHLRSTALALLEQQAGLPFNREWLNEGRPTYRVPDPHWMLRDVENAERP